MRLPIGRWTVRGRSMVSRARMNLARSAATTSPPHREDSGKDCSALRRGRRVTRSLTRPAPGEPGPPAPASATSRAPVTAASIATTGPAAMVATLARAEKVSVTARCQLDTTAPVATNPRTAAPSSTKPAGPPSSQPRALVPRDEPNHASPNAIRGKPGPATRDWEGIASLMRPLGPATPSRQLNCPPEPRQWHPHPDAAPAHVHTNADVLIDLCIDTSADTTLSWARPRSCRRRVALTNPPG